jgi:hypothetical protein
VTTQAENDTAMWDLYGRVNAAFAAGDIDVALMGAHELIRLFPSEAIGYSAATRFYVEINKPEVAETIAIEGLQKAGHDRWILHWLAEVAMKNGDIAKAEARWLRLTELFLNHREGYLRHIDCLMAQNKNSAIWPIAANYFMTLSSIDEADETSRIKLSNALRASDNLLASSIIWGSINPVTHSETYLTETWKLFLRTCEQNPAERLKPSRIRFLSVLACEKPDTDPKWVPKLHRELNKLFHSDKILFDKVITKISECQISPEGKSRQIQALLGLCECQQRKAELSQALVQLISFIQANCSHLLVDLNEMFYHISSVRRFETLEI